MLICSLYFFIVCPIIVVHSMWMMIDVKKILESMYCIFTLDTRACRQVVFLPVSYGQRGCHVVGTETVLLY